MANNSLWILEEFKKWLKNEIAFAEDIEEICTLEHVARKITELENE